MEPAKQSKKAKRKAEKKLNEKEISDGDSEMSMEEEINYTGVKKTMKDEEDWEEGDDEDMTVEFEFYDPNPNQFFSIKSLINGYLDGLSYRSSDLAQLIIEQVEVGTMIGTLDDEDENLIKYKPKDKNVLGFATVMNFLQYSKKPAFQEIAKYIADKSNIHNEKHAEFLKILNEKNVGLLINERIINLSPKLVPILHSQLLKDIEWAQNNNLNEKADANFQFDYILCVTKVFKDISVPVPKKKKNEMNLDELIFPKFEDYAILKKTPLFFMFPATTSKNNAGITNLESETNKEQCYRLIWLISMKQFDETFKGLDEYIEG